MMREGRLIVTAADNKALVHRLYEDGFNAEDVGILDVLLAPHFVDHTAAPGQAPGAAGIKDAWTRLHTAFPDIHLTVEDVIAEGDGVAARITLRGTHRGEFMGVLPTGRVIQAQGMEFVHIADGQIVDLWSDFNFWSVMGRDAAVLSQ